MREVENVTGGMGEGEAVTPAEEIGNGIASAGDAVEDALAEAEAEAAAGEGAAFGAPAVPGDDTGADPWLALARVGAWLVSAFATAGDPEAPAHPWIERDPATGVKSLKMPLPPPETARQLAAALTVLADGLRGGWG
jgi:hypothetical protein